MRCILGFVLLAMFLGVGGCATMEAQGTYTPRPGQNSGPSWWGSDPACSPGCPSGIGAGW